MQTLGNGSTLILMRLQKVMWSDQSIFRSKNIMEFLQDEANLQFGIGGFYQIDPDGLELNVPSSIEISYSESEIIGFDESELAVLYPRSTKTDNGNSLVE